MNDILEYILTDLTPSLIIYLETVNTERDAAATAREHASQSGREPDNGPRLHGDSRGDVVLAVGAGQSHGVSSYLERRTCNDHHLLRNSCISLLLGWSRRKLSRN